MRRPARTTSRPRRRRTPSASRRATLYAYTSRGQLRSEPVPGRPRERRYYREDVERLKERKEARRDPAKAAAQRTALGRAGAGVGHHPHPQRQALLSRAAMRSRSRRRRASNRWRRCCGRRKSDASDSGCSSSRAALPPRQLARLRTCARDPLTLLQAALPIAAAVDLASYDLRPAAVRQTGARIIRLLTTIIARPRRRGRPFIGRCKPPGRRRGTRSPT